MAGSTEPLAFTRIWHDFSGSSMAKGARITLTLISGAFALIPTRKSGANGFLPETQSSPEGLHLTLRDGPRESREPTTAKPIYGGLARRVRLTRVAGREQELRNDDRAFRP